MPIKWDTRADRKLFTLVLKIHQIKLDYKAMAEEFGEGVTPSSLQQHLRKITTSAPLSGEAPERSASMASDNGENSGGEGSKEKPAKKPRVKATGGEMKAKRGRKRKARGAAYALPQEKERDPGEDGITVIESESGNTRTPEVQGKVEDEDE